MRRWIDRGLAGVLGVQLSVALASAQTSTGVVTGSVVDPQGAVVAGASVRLVQERTGVARDAATDREGSFVFPSVPPERYVVEVEVPGFKKLERRGLVLTASERLAVGALRLETGAVAEVISVTSEAPAIQTASQERSAVLGERQIQSLSTQGRDYLNMLKVLPGVSYPDGAGAQSLGSSTAPIVSGIRGDYLAINVDGVVGNNRGTGTTENMINIDAISEVKVLLSNYQAEYGKNAGAIVNVVTKSGTRDCTTRSTTRNGTV